MLHIIHLTKLIKNQSDARILIKRVTSVTKFDNILHTCRIGLRFWWTTWPTPVAPSVWQQKSKRFFNLQCEGNVGI